MCYEINSSSAGLCTSGQNAFCITTIVSGTHEPETNTMHFRALFGVAAQWRHAACLYARVLTYDTSYAFPPLKAENESILDFFGVIADRHHEGRVLLCLDVFRHRRRLIPGQRPAAGGGGAALLAHRVAMLVYYLVHFMADPSMLVHHVALMMCHVAALTPHAAMMMHCFVLVRGSVHCATPLGMSLQHIASSQARVLRPGYITINARDLI